MSSTCFIILDVISSSIFFSRHDGLSSTIGDFVIRTMIAATRPTAILSAPDESRSRAAWKGGRGTADAASLV